MITNFNYNLSKMLEYMNELTNDWERLSESEREYYKKQYPFNKDLPLVNKDVRIWLEHLSPKSDQLRGDISNDKQLEEDKYQKSNY